MSPHVKRADSLDQCFKVKGQLKLLTHVQPVVMCASSMSVFNFRKSFGISEGQISIALRYLNKYHCMFCQIRFWFGFILTFR